MYGLRIVTISIAASLALGIFSSGASAQAVCGKRTDIVKQLEKKYGETRRSVGVPAGPRCGRGLRVQRNRQLDHPGHQCAGHELPDGSRRSIRGGNPGCCQFGGADLNEFGPVRWTGLWSGPWAHPVRADAPRLDLRPASHRQRLRISGVCSFSQPPDRSSSVEHTQSGNMSSIRAIRRCVYCASALASAGEMGQGTARCARAVSRRVTGNGGFHVQKQDRADRRRPDRWARSRTSQDSRNWGTWSSLTSPKGFPRARHWTLPKVRRSMDSTRASRELRITLISRAPTSAS